MVEHPLQGVLDAVTSKDGTESKREIQSSWHPYCKWTTSHKPIRLNLTLRTDEGLESFFWVRFVEILLMCKYSIYSNDRSSAYQRLRPCQGFGRLNVIPNNSFLTFGILWLCFYIFRNTSDSENMISGHWIATSTMFQLTQARCERIQYEEEWLGHRKNGDPSQHVFMLIQHTHIFIYIYTRL